MRSAKDPVHPISTAGPSREIDLDLHSRSTLAVLPVDPNLLVPSLPHLDLSPTMCLSPQAPTLATEPLAKSMARQVIKP
jgi:hypothetical protein